MAHFLLGGLMTLVNWEMELRSEGNIPKKVKQLESEFVKSVSCGAHCSACIAEPRDNDSTVSTGRLWVWGQNQGSNFPRLFCGAFEPNTIIHEVSCGASHMVALSEAGLLQAWGYNEYGQLGRGVTCDGLQGARIISSYAKFLDEAPEPVKITKVSCGENHTAAVSDKGEVYTWGLGNMGQLGHSSLQYGDKELLPRRVVSLDGIIIKDVACGGVHTCALTKEGALYALGWWSIWMAGFMGGVTIIMVKRPTRNVHMLGIHHLLTAVSGRSKNWLLGAIQPC